MGDTVRIGYYTQDNSDLPEDMKVIDYVREKGEYIHSGDGTLISAARMLDRFLFSGAQQHSHISQLSGGEKRRLYLLGVLMDDVNVLLLDEPTNDLDIQTLQILEDFIDHFSGPVIAVSHDRYFLDRIAQRIFAFEGNGQVTIYTGNYSDYAEKKQSQQPVAAPSAPKEKKADTRQRSQKLKIYLSRSQRIWNHRSRHWKPEQKIQQCDNDMAANSTNFAKLNDISKIKEELEEQLMDKMERWEYLMEKAEQIAQQK